MLESCNIYEQMVEAFEALLLRGTSGCEWKWQSRTCRNSYQGRVIGDAAHSSPSGRIIWGKSWCNRDEAGGDKVLSGAGLTWNSVPALDSRLTQAWNAQEI